MTRDADAEINKFKEVLEAVKAWDIKQAMNNELGVRFMLPEDLRKQIQEALK